MIKTLNLKLLNLKSLSRRKKVVICVAMLGAFYLIYSVVRARILWRNGAHVGQTAQSFMRNYHVSPSSHSDDSRPTVVYLSLGDSTAAGWGAHDTTQTMSFKIAQAMAKRGLRVYIVNFAVGGARLSDVLEKQIAKLQSVRPHLVTISVGANDTTRGTELIEYSNTLQKLKTALQASGARQILWANTPDMAQTPALPLLLSRIFAKRAQRQNAALTNTLRDTSIQIIDLYDKGKLIYSLDANLYASDLFHPSAQGYDVWAKLFVEKLDTEKLISKN